MEIKDIARIAKEKNIDFFFAQYVNMYGVANAKLVPANHLEDMFTDGACFAGFAAVGFSVGPDAPDLAAILRRAVGAQDCEALCKAAHSLKSSSANVGALGFSELCRELEAAGCSESLNGAGKLLAEFDRSFEGVTEALRTLLAQEAG